MPDFLPDPAALRIIASILIAVGVMLGSFCIGAIFGAFIRKGGSDKP